MAEAVFGLAGVVIGGLITGGTQVWLEWRREKASTRAAARLLADDLGTARMFFEHCLTADKWVDTPQAILTADLWNEHKAALAAVRKFTPWYPVASAFTAVNFLLKGISFPNVKEGDALGERGNAWVEIAFLSCRIAENALTDYAKTPHYKEPDASNAINAAAPAGEGGSKHEGESTG